MNADELRALRLARANRPLPFASALSSMSHARAEAMTAYALRLQGRGAHPGPPRMDGPDEDSYERYEAASAPRTALHALYFLVQVRDVVR